MFPEFLYLYISPPFQSRLIGERGISKQLSAMQLQRQPKTEPYHTTQTAYSTLLKYISLQSFGSVVLGEGGKWAISVSNLCLILSCCCAITLLLMSIRGNSLLSRNSFPISVQGKSQEKEILPTEIACFFSRHTPKDLRL